LVVVVNAQLLLLFFEVISGEGLFVVVVLFVRAELDVSARHAVDGILVHAADAHKAASNCKGDEDEHDDGSHDAEDDG